jgi:hypothetical protein
MYGYSTVDTKYTEAKEVDSSVRRISYSVICQKQNQTPWLESASVLYRASDRSPFVGEVSANFLRIEDVTCSAQRIPTADNLNFLDRSRYFLK